jgi:hypothetical protein
MQGNYRQNAEICRGVITLHDEGLLKNCLRIADGYIDPLCRAFAKETTEILNEHYDTVYSVNSVTSALKVGLPGFTGMTFREYVPPEKPDRKPTLADRVAQLEEDVASLRALLGE